MPIALGFSMIPFAAANYTLNRFVVGRYVRQSVPSRLTRDSHTGNMNRERPYLLLLRAGLVGVRYSSVSRGSARQ